MTNEQAPNLEQMEGAKSSLLTFCMYYYQALRQAGHGVNESKDIVAREILNLYERYAQISGIKFKPQTIINPMKLLDEIIADVKSLGVNARPLHSKLLDFKRLIEEEDQNGST